MWQKIKNTYHLSQAILGSLYYRFPSRKLKVIGVTGTDGKTTTTHLIYHILKESGKKVSMISSIYANIAGKTYDTGFHVTTPDVFPLHRFLQKSAAAGDEYFVLETTSHALAQNRVYGIKYQAGVLTNITHEHLDFHKTYEEYIKSKLRLLKRATLTLVNADDESFSAVKQLLNKKFYTYALKNKADFRIDLSKNLELPIAHFNKYNYLAAYALCKLLGIPENNILTALQTFKLPAGRLEVIYDKDFTAIIDFAHTPNAIGSALSAIKKHYSAKHGRLIHVFGSAGQRDASKRPFMGEESGTYADIVILTEEDYRTEDPKEISEQIAVGLKKKGFHEEANLTYLSNKTYTIILDRKKAIEKAVEIAKPGDAIVLTGKSHEKSLSRGKTEYPWNEKETLLNALNKLKVR